MRIELQEISGVRKEWETAHPVRALAIDGHSPVLDYLAKIAENESKKAARQAWQAMRLVAENRHPPRTKHVKKCMGVDEDIYEMRHKAHRIFFFYSKAGQAVAICTNTYRKGKGSDKKGQDKAIKLAAKMRKLCREQRGL